jgi:hypothetical protein
MGRFRAVHGESASNWYQSHAGARYREPDGTMTTERVILPWRSDIPIFRTGDLLVLETKILDR